MALTKSFGLDKGRGQAPVWGRLSPLPCPLLPPLVSWLFLFLGSCQGFPDRSKRAGLGFALESLESSGWCEERIREGSRGAGRLLRGSLELAPSTRLPLSRDRIPGLPSLSWRAPSYPPDSWAERWCGLGGSLGGSSSLVELHHLPHPPMCLLLQAPYTPRVPHQASGGGEQV